MAPRYFASEFPNDNLDLHAGAVWVVRSPCAPPEAELVLEETRPLTVGRTTKVAPPPLVTSAPEVTQAIALRAARDVPQETPGETTLEAWLTEREEARPAVAESLVEAPVAIQEEEEEEAANSDWTPVDPMTAMEPVSEAMPSVEAAAVVEPEPESPAPVVEVMPEAPSPVAPAMPEALEPVAEAMPEAAAPVADVGQTLDGLNIGALAADDALVGSALESMVVPASHAAEDLAPIAEALAPPPEASHVRMSESAAPSESALEGLPSETAMDVAPSDAPAEVAAIAEIAAPDEGVAAPAQDPFVVLVATLAEVASGAGLALDATALAALLAEGHAPAATLPESAVRGLVDGGLASTREGDVVLSDTFASTARAWRSVVREEDADFAACGSRMLDEWSADLVARLVGTPAKMDAFRRELRSRGVAAFGLLAAA